MPSEDTWQRFHDEVNVKVNSVMNAINEKHDKIKDENSILLVEITRVGVSLGGKMDAVHKRMDEFEKQIINLNHTVNGNASPGLKTRQAVTESRVRLISGLFFTTLIGALVAYLKLK